MTSRKHGKPLAVCLAIGLALAALPRPYADAIRSLVVDAARPGQLAIADLSVRLENWQPFITPPTTTGGDRQALEAARLEIRRLRLANRWLTGEATALDSANSSSTPSPIPTHPPLVSTDLVSARVLGRETIQAWQAGRILDHGRGLSRESLVVEPGHTTLDLGLDSGLASGQPTYAGRRVVGRISRVGRWSSTLQPLTDTRFRGLARLARPGRNRPVFSTRGMLEGTGDGFCRLTLVPATAAVAVGDAVYTDGRDQPGDWPMIYGTVVGARLPDGAPHWDIRIRPAINLDDLKHVEVLTRRINRQRTNSPGVLAQ